MSSTWPEIEDAQRKQKKDLKLSGDPVAKRVAESKGALDPQLWTMTLLTKLEISNIPNLSEIPSEIAKLKVLKELILSDNSISQIADQMGTLVELKTLILANNQLLEFPKALCTGLKNLQVLNVSQNKLSSLPAELAEMKELIILNLSHNNMIQFPLQICKLPRLSTLILCHNLLESLDQADFSALPLTTLDLSHNRLTEPPSEISLCAKLKELNLSDNPYKDKKFIKLLDSGKVKNILQQLKKNAPSKKKEEEEEEEPEPLRIRIENPPDILHAVITQNQTVRPYLVLTVIKGFHFDDTSFKNFIDLQTELHQTICKKRTAATIGTHDMALFQPPLTYSIKTPEKIKFMPLKADKVMTGVQLVKFFEETKDDSMLKYISLIKTQPGWPVLEDDKGEVLSVPPVINSKYSQISLQTKDILVEVTSATNLQICKDVMAAFLRRVLASLPSAEQQLVVEQVKVQGENGHVRTQYPSQKELQEICTQ